jgi:hypothetical protein
VKADAAGSMAHPSADFEQLGTQGFDLGGTPGQGQLETKEVHQVISGSVQEEAEGVGQKTVTTQAVGTKAVFELFDAIFALTAIVVEGKDVGGRSAAVVMRKRRLVPVTVCSALKQIRRWRGQVRAR